MKFWKHLIFGGLMVSLMGTALGAEDPGTTSTKLNAEEEAKPPWSGGIAATYNGGFRTDIDPYFVYELSAAFKFKNEVSLSILQPITHYTYVYQGQSELQASDTSVGFSRQLSDDFLGTKVTGKVKFTVPVSEFSRRANVLSKPGAAVKFSRSFLEKKLTAGLGFSGTYYVNRYKTTPTVPGAGGGRPLRSWLVGANMSSGYKFTDKWSLTGSAGYSYLEYEKVGFKNQFSSLGLINPPVHRYSFSLGTSYAASDKFSLSAGYGQGSQVEKMGGLELVVYDEMVTEWSVGASYSF